MASSATDQPLLAGVDIGGTKCLGVCLGVDGTVLVEERLPTPRGAANLTDTVATVVEALAVKAGGRIVNADHAGGLLVVVLSCVEERAVG